MKYLVFISLCLIGATSAKTISEQWCRRSYMPPSSSRHICLTKYKYQLCLNTNGTNELMDIVLTCPLKTFCKPRIGTPCQHLPPTTTTTTTTTTTERYSDCEHVRRDLLHSCQDYVSCHRNRQGKLVYYLQSRMCTGSREISTSSGGCKRMDRGHRCEIKNGAQNIDYSTLSWWGDLVWG